MKITTFEEIIAWQKSRDLCLIIYELFRKNRDYGFSDQIRRASVSIMNNIAEGFERKGNKEFRNFLYIAKGSCAELRSMLYLAIKLKYISQTDYKNLLAKSREVSRLLSGLIKSLNT